MRPGRRGLLWSLKHTVTLACAPSSGALHPGTRKPAPPSHESGLTRAVKLAGALVLKEPIGSCPGGHGAVAHHRCAGAGIARSVRAIRSAATARLVPPQIPPPSAPPTN